jgi:hypothetical protein
MANTRRRTHPHRIAKRKAEAAERNAEWLKKNVRQKMDALDKRLGKGKGAKKQRARLKAEKRRGS